MLCVLMANTRALDDLRVVQIQFYHQRLLETGDIRWQNHACGGRKCGVYVTTESSN